MDTDPEFKSSGVGIFWPPPGSERGGPWTQNRSLTRSICVYPCSSVVKLHGSCSGRAFRAFSLIEVIIAVGVFAVAVVVILALLPSMSRQAMDSADTLVAQSFPDSVRAELSRLAANGGFDALADRLPVMAAPLVDGLSLVAARDARRLYSPDYLPPPVAVQLPPAEQYFFVEVWRFSQPPLRHDPTSAVLAAYVRVSWPYQIPGATGSTPLSARSQLTFTVALNR